MKILPAALAATTAMSFFGSPAQAEPLDVGASAPTITATDEEGKPVNFAETYGRGLTLVYFYPKADTRGCTDQACSLRDNIVDLKALGLTVLGVSHDTPAEQKAFKEKYTLPFTLIADTESKVAQAFGVPTSGGGIPKRQSFLVKDGKIAWRSLSAQTKTHAEEVKTAIGGLK